MSQDGRRVIVVGAGGHARVWVSLLSQLPCVEIVGVADQIASSLGECIGSTKVVATFDALPSFLKRGVSWAALAIGDNRERAEWGAKLKSEGYSLMTVYHPSAVIEPDVQLGEGTIVCAGAVVCAGVVIGPGVIINSGAIVDHETVVGPYAHIGPGSCLAGRVTVGARTFIGAGCRVIDKVAIGDDCIIGAGSVVVEDIQNDTVAYGVPAKVRCHG